MVVKPNWWHSYMSYNWLSTKLLIYERWLCNEFCFCKFGLEMMKPCQSTENGSSYHYTSGPHNPVNASYIKNYTSPSHSRTKLQSFPIIMAPWVYNFLFFHPKILHFKGWKIGIGTLSCKPKTKSYQHMSSQTESKHKACSIFSPY